MVVGLSQDVALVLARQVYGVFVGALVVELGIQTFQAFHGGLDMLSSYAFAVPLIACLPRPQASLKDAGTVALAITVAMLSLKRGNWIAVMVIIFGVCLLKLREARISGLVLQLAVASVIGLGSFFVIGALAPDALDSALRSLANRADFAVAPRWQPAPSISLDRRKRNSYFNTLQTTAHGRNGCPGSVLELSTRVEETPSAELAMM